MHTTRLDTTLLHAGAAQLAREIVEPLHQLLRAAVASVGADKGSLQLYDVSQQSFETITQVGFDQDFPNRFESHQAESWISTLGSQMPLIIRHDLTDSTFKEYELIYQSYGIVSVQSTPLLGRHGNLIGTLSMHFCCPPNPSERQLRFLEICRDQIVRLIEHEQAEHDSSATAERLARQNDELQQTNATLSRSNQELERFAFAASHDLQEPLRMITVYAQLLAQRYDKEFDKDSAMFMDNIIQGAKRMSDLLSDLLAYAEIGASRDEPLETVDLNRVVEKVKQNLKMSIDESGASIVAGELPAFSAARECHFVQLFQNLIGNAIKYGDRQTPQIHISVEEKGGGLEFAVADNGVGVGSEYHQRIFQPFQRLHDSKRSGTGIGLAICQRVVELYGGRIWVDSQMGHGATFRFTLPTIEIHPARKPERLEKSDVRKVRILLVEDSAADVSLIRLALKDAELNCDLTVIDDGVEALAYARLQGKYAGSPTPDLAVLDWNLPKADGLEILQAMSENRAFAGVPVVILSSGLSRRDLAKIQQHGLARYITKPTTLEEFLKIGSSLKAILEQRDGRRTSGALA